MNLGPNDVFAILTLLFLVAVGIMLAALKPKVKWIQDADKWAFGHGSPTTMGVFRILVGGLTFTNFCMIAIDFDAWFTERGYAPWRIVEMWQGPGYRFTVLNGVTDTTVTAIVYALVVISAFLTMIGLWTRPASIALAIGTISLHMRNPILLHGGDTVMRAATIYVALAPSGAACSVDRLIALWKGRAPMAQIVSLWPQRLVQFQLALIYFTAVWHKRFGSHWLDGTATWYPAHLSEFDKFPMPGLATHPVVVAITTYGTMLIQFALATLVFYRPLRKWVLIGGLVVHGIIEYSMNVPLFAFMICSLYISHYDGEEVAGWFRRLGDRFKRQKIEVRAPAGQNYRSRARATLEAMDPLGLVRWATGATSSWSASKSTGEECRNPIMAAQKRSMGAWPLSIVPGMWRKLCMAAIEPATAVVEGPLESERPHVRSTK